MKGRGGHLKSLNLLLLRKLKYRNYLSLYLLQKSMFHLRILKFKAFKKPHMVSKSKRKEVRKLTILR